MDRIGVVLDAIPSTKGFENTMYCVHFDFGQRMVFETELRPAPIRDGKSNQHDGTRKDC